MNSFYIPIVLGTARKGRQSEKVANFIFEQTKKFAFKSKIIDVRDFRIEATNNTKKIPQAQKLLKEILKADALIIVSPEYNHGYPGELKMTLDMLYQEYKGKPVGLCGVSSGDFGGTRAMEQLKQFVLALGMVPIQTVLYFPGVQNLFDHEGRIKDNLYFKRAEDFLKELSRYAKKLKKVEKNNY